MTSMILFSRKILTAVPLQAIMIEALYIWNNKVITKCKEISFLASVFLAGQRRLVV